MSETTRGGQGVYFLTWVKVQILILLCYK